MGNPLDYAPIAAAAFAIPQFMPQILKLRRTDDPAGVSWPWAALTSVNNAAWLAYFALSAYWAALVPASSATLLAGALATMLARRGQARARPAVLIGAWAALLAAALAAAGRAGLGTLLTAAFILQVTPSIWTAYRTARPTGISQGTWLLIFGELSCWTVFGIHKADPRLIVLGFTGVAASLLMLARIRRTTAIQRSAAPSVPADSDSPTAASCSQDARPPSATGRRWAGARRRYPQPARLLPRQAAASCSVLPTGGRLVPPSPTNSSTTIRRAPADPAADTSPGNPEGHDLWVRPAVDSRVAIELGPGGWRSGVGSLGRRLRR